MTVFAVILIKVTVIVGLALIGTRLARHGRASVRHLVLASSFGVLLILPGASVVAPAVEIAMPAAMQEAIVPLEGAAEVPVTATARPDAASATIKSKPLSAWLSWPVVLAAAWSAGTAAFLCPILLGLWQVRSLRRESIPWREGEDVMGALVASARVKQRVALLMHESVAGPMTCGILRPAIILPIDARNWTAEDLRRAVVHELEHVRRADWLTQVLARIVGAMYWFHPIVWVALRQLGLEAERACDDAVLSVGPDSSVAYADQLVGLAERLSATATQPHLAMANRKDLAARVIAVLDNAQQRGRAGRPWAMLTCVVAALVLVAISPLHLVARAQTSAQAPAPAQRLKYDTASIKPCVAEENPTGARGTAGGTNATFSPGRFFVPCVTTGQLIYLAYASSGAPVSDRLVNDDPGSASNPTKVRGGPAWVHSLRDKYSVEATASGATERTVLMGYMLRSLLEDRFKLKLHRDTEEADMYALSVGKGGLKIKPMKEGDCDPDAEPVAVPTNATPRCGVLNMVGVEGKIRWTFGGLPLSSLAGRLSSQFKVHVTDRTNIKDQFVFRFEFTRDPDPLVTETAVFAAVEEQLGLKLERTKGPRGFLVIDHIERPTPDAPDVFRVPVRARAAGGPR